MKKLPLVALLSIAGFAGSAYAQSESKGVIESADPAKSESGDKRAKTKPHGTTVSAESSSRSAGSAAKVKPPRHHAARHTTKSDKPAAAAQSGGPGSASPTGLGALTGSGHASNPAPASGNSGVVRGGAGSTEAMPTSGSKAAGSPPDATSGAAIRPEPIPTAKP